MEEWVTEGIRSSGWFLWAPLVAAYAPRGLRKMYLNLHLRRYARWLVPFLDPFVTIDIVSKSSRSDNQSSVAFEEAKAYLIKMCSRDVLEFSAEGTVEGSSFMLSLGEGQEVADHFQGVTVWWLLVPRDVGLLQESRLRLMFPQRHRTLILDEYLPHVRRQGHVDMFLTIDIVNDTRTIIGEEEFKSSDEALFEEVKAYLTGPCSRDALDLCAEATVKDDSCLLSLREGAEVADRFRGVTLWWLLVPTSKDKPKQILRLMFVPPAAPGVDPGRVPTAYVNPAGQSSRGRKGYKRVATRGSQRNKPADLSPGSEDSEDAFMPPKKTSRNDSVWCRVDTEHPATFDTLAMHPNKRHKITEDLDNFRRNKDYYRRIGKPWKRGYLLYGPTGTGKSTMIAAMANYLNYDIFDIELTSIDCCFEDFNAQRMKNKRQIISSGYEDKEKVTMSGLLNFIDGVWSAQSGERIIVLTTNFLDKLDPSLIRRGRMDVHIEMSYCCFEAFKTLARNYLGIGGHPLFQRVEELLQVVEIIPADVAECLLKADAPTDSDRGGVETCLGRLIDELEKKAREEKDNKAAAKPKRQRR
ncbi:unnamed protein product [Urochloa decumbens]|uniref:AAA+ ATPase domain-containing protein n=1 Tax=Urochloa decumbens TaxID=240449 RepID=A0ABC9GD14_9POAL